MGGPRVLIHSLCALEILPGKHWIVGEEQGEEEVEEARGLGPGVGGDIVAKGRVPVEEQNE